MTDNCLPSPSPRFLRGLQANLRYWQAQTAVINDDIIRNLDPDFPNVLQVVEMGLVLAETWPDTAVLILQCFFWVEGSGRVPQWQPLVEKCLAVMPTPDDWLEFRLLKQLGQFQRIQWDLDTAVNTFQQARVGAQTLQDDQAIAEIHMNLCQTLHRQHRYDDAQAAGVKALTLFTESQCRLKATTMQSLGHLAQEQGQYDLAETHFREALNLMRNCEITSITDITRTMDALAETHRAKKQYASAIQLYQEIADLLAATTEDEDKIRVNLNNSCYAQIARRLT
ncbi:MAG: tetratricopeptide repeat protein [Ardenticatenaceae bacterium]|nr:tetratricopeptide repeat protein [Ardenticatenaceae bacterium]MCB9443258.1 tetratricopeptide repeat protein [Ardenticatenaceae bacterium]